MIDIFPYFQCLQTIRTLELGCSDRGGGAVGTLARRLETEHEFPTLGPKPTLPSLKQLTFHSMDSTHDELARLHEVCSERGVEMIAGFDTEADFPITWA